MILEEAERRNMERRKASKQTLKHPSPISRLPIAVRRLSPTPQNVVAVKQRS